jgi:hypothetical protein
MQTTAAAATVGMSSMMDMSTPGMEFDNHGFTEYGVRIMDSWIYVMDHGFMKSRDTPYSVLRRLLATR